MQKSFQVIPNADNQYTLLLSGFDNSGNKVYANNIPCYLNKFEAEYDGMMFANPSEVEDIYSVYNEPMEILYA